jgi:FtsP/CotA-like multicopper oxidase with cupredoxin domain
LSFPVGMPEDERRAIAIVSAVFLVILAVTAGILAALIAGVGGDGAEAQPVREYNLEIVPTDIDYGGGNVWHAWTFKDKDAPEGTVPGPTIRAEVGERLVVNIENKLDLVHSFHTHLTNYDFEFDGSQANIIGDVGAGAMIPPGESYTYEFTPTEAGLYYYHCHSADGELDITTHIHQGLYGAIVIEDPDEPPIREEVVFMSEIGFDTEGDDLPPFIMNGLGLPGGEHALEAAYHDGGFEAVEAQLNKTVPAFTASTNEEMRVHVVNIGDQVHSFHAHSVKHISEGVLGDRAWPANLLPLIPGAADTLRLNFTKPGIWLFHCHVVGHADRGMIGVFVVEDAAPDAEAPES